MAVIAGEGKQIRIVG